MGEQDDWIEVGYVAQAFGVKGEIKVAPHASHGQGGDALLSARGWRLSDGREQREVSVLQARAHGASITAQLKGLDDRDAAEALKGWGVSVRRGDFPPPQDDEFYWVDLIGLEVVNLQGETLGQVAGLLDNGAHSILRVCAKSASGDAAVTAPETLVPFVDAYVKQVDLATRRIEVDWQSDF